MVTVGHYSYDEHFVMYILVKSLCCISATNVVLFITIFQLRKRKMRGKKERKGERKCKKMLLKLRKTAQNEYSTWKK